MVEQLQLLAAECVVAMIIKTIFIAFCLVYVILKRENKKSMPNHITWPQITHRSRTENNGHHLFTLLVFAIFLGKRRQVIRHNHCMKNIAGIKPRKYILWDCGWPS